MTTMSIRSNAAERIAGDVSGAVSDSFQFNRRRDERRAIDGDAVAVFTETIGPGKIVSVSLLDASETGLGVRSSVPVAPGAAFSLMSDRSVRPRHVGIVVRCERETDGSYRVGLRSKPSPVAA